MACDTVRANAGATPRMLGTEGGQASSNQATGSAARRSTQKSTNSASLRTRPLQNGPCSERVCQTQGAYGSKSCQPLRGGRVEVPARHWIRTLASARFRLPKGTRAQGHKKIINTLCTSTCMRVCITPCLCSFPAPHLSRWLMLRLNAPKNWGSRSAGTRSLRERGPTEGKGQGIRTGIACVVTGCGPTCERRDPLWRLHGLRGKKTLFAALPRGGWNTKWVTAGAGPVDTHTQRTRTHAHTLLEQGGPGQTEGFAKQLEQDGPQLRVSACGMCRSEDSVMACCTLR
jgi:hypothetical protein